MIKKILSAILCAIALIPLAFADPNDIQFSAGQFECLQKLVYFNECSDKPENLTTWRNDEAFPSLGIGHFIWYPADQRAPFNESFPEFRDFLKKNNVVVPVWLEKDPPWQTREAFQKDLQSERMIALREFLNNTKALQVQFMMERMKKALPAMLEASLKEKRSLIEEKYYRVANVPNGMIAMIDYVNFKGEGTSLKERLQGQGWGLLQVLEEMEMPQNESEVLSEFVRAAERVLETRVKNIMEGRDANQALKGWKNRVRNYLKIVC